jgi:hypothetical protein
MTNNYNKIWLLLLLSQNLYSWVVQTDYAKVSRLGSQYAWQTLESTENTQTTP